MQVDPRIRVCPRISLNKLGEYTTATPVRRRGIVVDQKRPRDVVVARYRPAREATILAFEGGFDAGPIRDAIGALRNAPGDTDWQKQDIKLSAEALQSLLGFTRDVATDGLSVQRAARDLVPLVVEGVAVSVRPSLILRGRYRGMTVCGAVKFYFGKTHVLSEDAGFNAATILHQYVEEHLVRGNERVSPRHCMVVDVFAQAVHRAPRNYKRRRADVAAACQEIALRWDQE